MSLRREIERMQRDSEFSYRPQFVTSPTSRRAASPDRVREMKTTRMKRLEEAVDEVEKGDARRRWRMPRRTRQIIDVVLHPDQPPSCRY
jgi:hypothetical protein